MTWRLIALHNCTGGRRVNSETSGHLTHSIPDLRNGFSVQLLSLIIYVGTLHSIFV